MKSLTSVSDTYKLCELLSYEDRFKLALKLLEDWRANLRKQLSKLNGGNK